MGKTKKANVTITETKDVDENMVYVYNSKQSTNVPSLSPWFVALETFMRFNKIEYKKAAAEKRVDKMHGDPKVLLNRQEYIGLNTCMDTLAKHFEKDDANLSADQNADAEAFVKADVETVLFNALTVIRMKKGQEGMHEILKRIQSRTQQLLKPKDTDDRSMMKMSTEDLLKRIKDVLSAVDNYLHRGDKTYLFGDKPTKFDAIVFGVLVQMYFEPTSNEYNLKEYFDTDMPRLVSYMTRIKDAFWSDWTDCCAPPPPPPAPKKETAEKEKEKTATTENANVNGNASEHPATTPNGAVDDKIPDADEDEKKIAPKAVEEPTKPATPEEKKSTPTTVDIVVKTETIEGTPAVEVN